MPFCLHLWYIGILFVWSFPQCPTPWNIFVTNLFKSFLKYAYYLQFRALQLVPRELLIQEILKATEKQCNTCKTNQADLNKDIGGYIFYGTKWGRTAFHCIIKEFCNNTQPVPSSQKNLYKKFTDYRKIRPLFKSLPNSSFISVNFEQKLQVYQATKNNVCFRWLS